MNQPHFRSQALSGPAKRYLHAVRHELCLRGPARHKALSPLKEALREHPEYSYDQIVTQIGTCGETALELNQSIPGFLYSKSYWRFAFLPLGLIGLWGCLQYLGFRMFCQFLLHYPGFLSPIYPGNEDSIGIIGGADGPTAIFITDSPAFTSSLSFAACLLLSVIGIGGYYLLRHRKTPL